MDNRGDFNDIKNQEEKKGGRARPEHSFAAFRKLIAKMEMGEIKFKEGMFTWATIEKERDLNMRD